MIGCLCGGIFELFSLFAIATVAGISTYVCTSLYNIKCYMKSKKCKCKCGCDLNKTS